MAVRVTRNREFTTQSGSTLGMQVNVHGLVKLQAGVTGDLLAPILVDSLQPALVEAKQAWPILTGASVDSMDVVVIEIGERHARVNLQVGGDRLRNDPRNPSRKDYAPYIEYNGSPAGRGQGTMVNAFLNNEREMRHAVRDGVAQLIREILA